MVKQDCAICCETFTKLQFITCNYCNFDSCKSCTQRYILDTSNDPHCMSCKKPWSREFLDSAFTKKFVNTDLKKRRESVLLDREKAMLPATQAACEREKTVRRMRNEAQDMYQRKRILQQEIYAVNVAIRQQETDIYRVRNNLLQAEQAESSNGQRKQFVRKCPKEDCKGFLSTQWKCGLCESNVCKDCNEVLTVPKEEHTCDENAKATVAMLAKDTKPCPSCGTMIFRISGCSQMWCPDCHTTFCWNTGRIETGMVHNPHYFEWLRRTGGNLGRAHGDFECGGLPVIHAINALGTIIKKYEIFVNIYRLLIHIQRVEINRYHVGDAAQNNEDLRINYMLNEISEEVFAHTLQKREKDRQKKNEYYQVYQMLFNTGAEYMRQLHQSIEHCFERDNNGTAIRNYYRAQPMKIIRTPDSSEIDIIAETFENLRTYANENFEKIGSRYKCKYPTVPTTWREIV